MTLWGSYPQLEPGKRRTLFVMETGADDVEAMSAKGYDLVDVRAMPRTNDLEHIEAISAWLQGMTEGTIPADAERRKNIELEARLYGALVNRSMRIDATVSLDSMSIEDLLGARSRKTLNGADATAVLAALRASVVPGTTTNEKN